MTFVLLPQVVTDNIMYKLFQFVQPPHSEHITPVIQHLHWRPVTLNTVVFKVLTTIKKALHSESASAYLN